VPIPHSTPIKWVPRGLTDADDGTNSFSGAMHHLVNLIPDPRTSGVWVPRPAAQKVVDFAVGGGPTGAGVLQAMLTVGDLEYGMVASSLNAGKDEPYCFDLENGVFLPVSGITNANTPTTQPSAGDWTPPIMAQVAGRVIVCHPGFPGGAIKFGWFDVSGFSETVFGNTHTNTTITGNPSILGMQPGMSISGAGIPADTSIAATEDFILSASGFVSGTSVTSLSSVIGIAVGQEVFGLGIPAGTTITAIPATALITTGDTHSSTLIDNIDPTSGIPAILDIVTGAGIPANTTVFQVAHVSIAIAASLNATTTIHTQTATGIVAAQFVSGFGITSGTKVVSSTPFSLDTSGDITVASFTIINLASTTGIVVGYGVTASFLPFGAVVVSIDSPTQVTISQAANQSVTGTYINFSGSAVVLDAAATATASFVTLTFESLAVLISQAASATASGVTLTFTSVILTLSNSSILPAGQQALTFVGTVLTLSQAATATADGVSLTIAGGTRAAPLWGAGDCDRNPLPSVPLGVMQMNGRAYFADGDDGVVFSDSGLPCRRSNQPVVQALTTNDGTSITAIAPLELSAPITGGIVQAAIAFSGDGAMRQITGDMATNDLKMNLLPVATGTLAPLSIIPCSLGTAFVSPQGLRFVRPDGSVTDPVGTDGQGVTNPMQYALYPSRICAEANVSVLRISLQNGAKTGEPFEEYWFDLSRKIWSGPHSFPARLIQHWRSTFVIAPVAVAASLWRSDSVGPAFATGTEADFTEHGFPMVWYYQTVLLPDNESMAMNAMVESNLALAFADDGVTANPVSVAVLDEAENQLASVSLTPPAITGNPGLGNLRQRSLDWSEVVIFKQMAVRVAGISDSRIKVGNLYMRYQILGWNVGILEVPFQDVTTDSGSPLVPA